MIEIGKYRGKWHENAQDIGGGRFLGVGILTGHYPDMYFKVIKNKGRGIAVIMNCKTGGSMRLSLRKQECLKALKEIAENGYDREIRKDYGTVREFGIVFGRKYCNVMGGSTSD